MTKVFSIILYWLVILPIGLFQRIFGINKFDPGLDKTASTYWLPRDTSEKPAERYRRQY